MPHVHDVVLRSCEVLLSSIRKAPLLDGPTNCFFLSAKLATSHRRPFAANENHMAVETAEGVEIVAFGMQNYFTPLAAAIPVGTGDVKPLHEGKPRYDDGCPNG